MRDGNMIIISEFIIRSREAESSHVSCFSERMILQTRQEDDAVILDPLRDAMSSSNGTAASQRKRKALSPVIICLLRGGEGERTSRCFSFKN